MCAISSLTSTFAISSPDEFLFIWLCYIDTELRSTDIEVLIVCSISFHFNFSLL